MSPGKTARAVAVAAVVVVAACLVAPSDAYACVAANGVACGGAIVTVATGTLSVSVPDSLLLTGQLGAGASFATTLSTVQVQDGRTPLTGWSLSAVTSGDLTTGGATPHTLPLGTSIVGGPLTLTTGTISPGPLTSLVGVTAGTGGSLNPARAVSIASALAGFGGGSYSMTPTVRLTPPPNTFAGTYTTTITFTVTG